MKRTLVTLVLAAAASTLTALAADPTPTPAPAGNPPPPAQQEGFKRHHDGPGGPLECLTPAEREQLKAAHKTAKKDPAVVEAKKNLETAHKAFMEAEKAALLKADQTLAPVLDKLEKARKEHHPRKGGPGAE